MLLAFAVNQSVSADEVWNSTYGKVIYENEIGSTAVWSYNYQGTEGWIYIDKLAGVYQGRGTYEGYWIQASSAEKCSSQKMMNGKASPYWGKLTIQFLDPDFPSRWQAKWNYCDKKPIATWQGLPVTN